MEDADEPRVGQVVDLGGLEAIGRDPELAELGALLFAPAGDGPLELRSITWLMPIDATNPQPSANANNKSDFGRIECPLRLREPITFGVSNRSLLRRVRRRQPLVGRFRCAR